MGKAPIEDQFQLSLGNFSGLRIVGLEMELLMGCAALLGLAAGNSPDYPSTEEWESLFAGSSCPPPAVDFTSNIDPGGTNVSSAIGKVSEPGTKLVHTCNLDAQFGDSNITKIYTCEADGSWTGLPPNAMPGCMACAHLDNNLVCKDWECFCHQIIFDETNWASSEKACLAVNSHLPIIKTTQQRDFLAIKARNVKVWVGLRWFESEGVWAWPDGSAFDLATDIHSFDSGKGQPAKGPGAECVVTDAMNPGLWLSKRCEDRDVYILCLVPLTYQALPLSSTTTSPTTTTAPTPTTSTTPETPKASTTSTPFTAPTTKAFTSNFNSFLDAPAMLWNARDANL